MFVFARGRNSSCAMTAGETFGEMTFDLEVLWFVPMPETGRGLHLRDNAL